MIDLIVKKCHYARPISFGGVTMQQSVSFIRIPVEVRLPIPGFERYFGFRLTEKYYSDKYETPSFSPDHLQVLEWDLVTNPIPELPNPTVRDAHHFVWTSCTNKGCPGENDKNCVGKKISARKHRRIIPKWAVLFQAWNAEHNTLYRIDQISEHLESLRNVTARVRSYLNDPTGYSEEVLKRFPLADEHRVLNDFADTADCYLKLAEEARKRWGKAAVASFFPDW